MDPKTKCTMAEGLGWSLGVAMTLAGCAMPASQATAPAAPVAAAKAGAVSGTMAGKVVWVDLKNSALLVVCQDDAGCKDVSGKKGETYTLIIPPAMKKAAEGWKEGGAVKVTFEDRDDGGRSLKSVNASP